MKWGGEMTYIAFLISIIFLFGIGSIGFMGYFLRMCSQDEPNGAVGYRAKRSISSKEAWKYSNELAGNINIKLGKILLIFNLCILAINAYIDLNISYTIILVFLIISFCFEAIYTIVKVEKGLKENYNSRGIPKIYFKK